jgi:hypothetical protein
LKRTHFHKPIFLDDFVNLPGIVANPRRVNLRISKDTGVNDVVCIHIILLMPLYGNKKQKIREKIKPRYLAKSFKNREKANTPG